MPEIGEVIAERARRAIIHHAVDRGPALRPFVVDRARGLEIWDVDGRRYLDMTSGGVFAVTLGFGRDDVIEAMARQARAVSFTAPYGTTTRMAVQLAERISAVAPAGPTATFFCNSGSEAVEAAVKFARQYHRAVGEPARREVIARRRAYHGSTMGALAATGSGPGLNSALRLAAAPAPAGYRHAQPAYCFRCELGLAPPTCGLACAVTIEQEILSAGPETVSCVLVEPIMTSAGAVVPPDGYFERVHEICRRYGVLLICDEVACGFGRLGHWFGAEAYGIEPDIMVLAKGLTGGYQPMGAAVVRREIADAVPIFQHAHTTGGHPVAAAAALATMSAIEDEQLLDHARTNGRHLLEAARHLQRSHPDLVVDARGQGLFVGLELRDRRPRSEHEGRNTLADLIAQEARAAGVLVRPMAGTTIVLAPALTVTRAAIETTVDVLDEVLRSVEGRGLAGYGSAFGAHGAATPPPNPASRGDR